MVGLTVAGPAVAAGQTSVSIYSDGRVLVRRTVAQRLERGRQTLTVALEGLDPATLFSPDSLVSVQGARVRYPTTADAALGAAVGQALSFGRERDTVRATVVRADPLQLRLADGRIVLSPPGVPLFPAGLVRSAPEASIVVEAAQARPRTQLAYVTQGAAWETLYQVILGARQAAVAGSATITPGALRADSAEVQLVAGSIRRTRAGAPAPEFGVMAAAPARAAEDVAAEEAVGETHVYTLPGRHTLEPGVPLTVALFPRGATAYGQELIVPGVIPFRGYFGGFSTEPLRQPVQVWYTLQRTRGTAFGDRPLPAGTVQLYQPDSAGRVQLVGEATIGHTAAGRELRVQSGDAFDVTAERVQTEYNVEQLPPARRGLAARRRVTAAFRVTLANAKGEAVTVDVREAHFGEWRVVESSVPAERLSAHAVRFRVPVPANGEATLTYTVQIDS